MQSARGTPVVVLLAASAFATGCGDTSTPSATRGLELIEKDYALARTDFHTKLVRQGPAPQRYGKVHAPQDAQEVDYTSGGLRLKAWVSRPAPGDRKRPGVVFLHGGFAFGEDDWDQCRPFRTAGFAVMTPLLRGENGQPGSFSMFYDEVDDVLAAAAALARRPDVDAKRLYVAGHSAGGTLTLLAALASPGFKAAASFSGSCDRINFVRNGFQQVTPFSIGDIREFQMRSPVAYATSFKCPTRIFYGSEESFFDAESRRTAALAREKGLDVEAVTVRGDHLTSVPAAMEQAIAFFRGH